MAPQDTASPGAPLAARRLTDRLRDLASGAVTALAVALSMVLIAYQTWRMRPQLGAESAIDGLAMTVLLALLPTLTVHQLAKRWTGRRWTDWLGVLLISALAFGFTVASKDYLTAQGVDRPWVGALGFTFFAALGPATLAMHQQERALGHSDAPAPGEQ